jgi:hypothetical protein
MVYNNGVASNISSQHGYCLYRFFYTVSDATSSAGRSLHHNCTECRDSSV